MGWELGSVRPKVGNLSLEATVSQWELAFLSALRLAPECRLEGRLPWLSV